MPTLTSWTPPRKRTANRIHTPSEALTRSGQGEDEDHERRGRADGGDEHSEPARDRQRYVRECRDGFERQPGAAREMTHRGRCDGPLGGTRWAPARSRPRRPSRGRKRRRSGIVRSASTTRRSHQPEVACLTLKRHPCETPHEGIERRRQRALDDALVPANPPRVDHVGPRCSARSTISGMSSGGSCRSACMSTT